MTNKQGKLVEIQFEINGCLYQARVFLNRPTAILIPNQNIIATTNLGPQPDSSTKKNRYQKKILLTEKEEAIMDRKEAVLVSRSIYDQTGTLNNLSIREIQLDQPFVVDCRPQVIATCLSINYK